MKTIHQIVHFKASSSDIYTALMDSKKHAAFTGEKAVIFPKVNGRFEVYDGYAVGTFIKLEPNALIESTWKEATEDWPAGHYSKVQYQIYPDKVGTKLELTQTDVPDDRYDDISQGWHDYYWQPLAEYLVDRRIDGK